MLLLVACASGPQPDGVDHWEEASAVCVEPSEACSARLREDFGVEDFEHVENILEALRYMVVWDLGTWPPPEDAFVHAESLDLYEDWPGESTSARVYNYAAVAVETVEFDNELMIERDAFAGYLDGAIYVGSALASFTAASVAPMLVHESAHATWPRHRDCDGMACDPSWAGAYGTQAAVAWIAAGKAEGVDARSLRNAAEDAAEHVVEE